MIVHRNDVVCMDHKTVLTTPEYQAMVHALGLTRRGGRGRFGRRWAYRNYFSAGAKDIELWRGLADRGLARLVSNPGELHPDNALYEVTHAGIDAIDATRYVPRGILDYA